MKRSTLNYGVLSVLEMVTIGVAVIWALSALLIVWA